MTIQEKSIRYVIKGFKAEMKENRVEMKECVRDCDYAAAAHLQSVNGALDYVIGVLNREFGSRY